MKKDLNTIAQIEKAIAKKYGKSATVNPKSSWTPEKEKKHLQSVKKFYDKCDKARVAKRESASSNSIEAAAMTTCPNCSKLFLEPRDEIYVKKFECCHWCYTEFVEGREDRWQSGWRPDKQSLFKIS